MADRVLTATYLDHGVALGYLHADLDIPGTAREIDGMILASILTGLAHRDSDELRRGSARQSGA